MVKFSELYNSKSHVEEKNRFFGYKEITKEIIKNLYGKISRSYIILGGRRIGKTSFLWNFKNNLCNSCNSQPFKIIPVYMDLRGLQENSRDGVFNKLLMGQMKMQNKNINDNTKNKVIGFNYFLEYLEKESKNKNNFRIIFLIDELDALLNQEWLSDLLGNFRFLITSSEIKDKISFLFAGLGDIYYISQPGSPLYNVLQSPIWLKALPEKDALELIKKPSGNKTSNGVSKYIYEVTGGHPYLIHSIMEKIKESDPKRVKKETIGNILSILELNDELKRWYDKLDFISKKIYYCLFKKDKTMEGKEIAKECEIDYEKCDRCLKELLSYGIIGEENTGYKIINKIFKDYFEEYHKESFEKQISIKEPKAFIYSPQVKTATDEEIEELIKKKESARRWIENNMSYLQNLYGGKHIAYSEDRVIDSDEDYNELEKRVRSIIPNLDNFEIFYIKKK